MTVVVFGLDALDPDLVDGDEHPNLTLNYHRAIETFVSSSGSPSTHELWPTIITGLPPEEHGLQLDNGVAWENPIIELGSNVADYLLPHTIQARLGAWLLNNTAADTFRTPSTYFTENDIRTVFDGHESVAIGVPNYVTDPKEEDREQQLRRSLGDLFRRDSEARGGHETADLGTFYEQCMEMVMIRVARVRRALRSRRYELVFGYTSGLDLIGHVTHDRPEVQQRAYEETDDFVGELRSDLEDGDELLVVSDHGLQDGLHTEEAMIVATDDSLIEGVDSVLDIYGVVVDALADGSHEPTSQSEERAYSPSTSVEQHLDDLGYL